jgi:catechol 2,3-dioxygenase-like lactoylglutathione lyase family enzyme
MEGTFMQTANKLMMVAVNVADMAKSKAFYVKKLGFEISTEYRQDDNNWWTGLVLPGGGATLTLSRTSVSPENVKSGTLTMYFEALDLESLHKELEDKDVVVSDTQPDLFGPGSNVKWFSTKDPDDNQVMFAEKHDPRAPF